MVGQADFKLRPVIVLVRWPPLTRVAQVQVHVRLRLQVGAETPMFFSVQRCAAASSPEPGHWKA